MNTNFVKSLYIIRNIEMIQKQHTRNRLSLLISLLVLFSLLSITTSVRAQQTYYAGCTNGVGSVKQLINAIENANAAQGQDVIVLGDAGEACLYNLQNIHAYTDVGDPIGLPIITDDLAIYGNGSTIQRTDDAHPVPAFRLLHVEGQHHLQLEDLLFTNGMSKEGGAVHIKDGHLELYNSSFTNNTVELYNNGRGGAVYANRLTAATVHFSNNMGRYGGAAHAIQSASLDNVSFINNYAYYQGGGLHVSEVGSELSVSNSRFVNNKSDWRGGGLTAVTKNIVISHSIFKNNTAPNRLGGAMSITPSNIGFKATIFNNLFLHNSAADGGSAISFWSNAAATDNPIQVDIWHNTIDEAGTRLYHDPDAIGSIMIQLGQENSDAYINISNNIITNTPNTAINYGYLTEPLVPISTESNLYFNNFLNEHGVVSSINNVVADPQFVDSTNGDYQLLSSSPAIDTGSLLPVVDDLLGMPRPQGNAPDRGAYEVNPDSDGDGIPNEDDNCPLVDATGLDADGDGCLDSLDGLEILILSMNLPHGAENALLTKVYDAQAAFNNGDIAGTEAHLNALLNHIAAQSGQDLTVEQANLLTAYIQNILIQL